ncbi:SdpI family protein [Fulvivirga sp.]|uniref:SdpI family protein n=1 Tax=Fulvivirga sp. TaxID=1931237 RepID=UPI0032ED4BC1
MDETILTQLLIGPLFLVLIIIFRAFPPKSINGIYGYRTPYSMKSQEAWDEANRFSLNLMLGVGIIVTLTQIVLYFTLAGQLKLIIPTILLVVLLIAIIPVTEIHLRKYFDKEGKPKGRIE